ncbi:MAG TPA: YetF domain-containing protein, partial [Gaiellaceae bacterium]|nr:YetF domain-containing protein [Gaiellaceae bacterium]
TQDDYSVTGAVIVVGAIATLQLTTSWLSFKFPRLRPVLDGEPIVVIENGKPIERNMKRERLTLEEVMAEARQQEVSSLDEIQWAVLETAGKISFIKKQ